MSQDRSGVETEPEVEVDELTTPAQLAGRILTIFAANDPGFGVTLVGGLCQAILKRDADYQAATAAAADEKLAAQEEQRQADQRREAGAREGSGSADGEGGAES